MSLSSLSSPVLYLWVRPGAYIWTGLEYQSRLEKFCAIGFFNESDTLQSSSMLIYSALHPGLYTQRIGRDAALINLPLREQLKVVAIRQALSLIKNIRLRQKGFPGKNTHASIVENSAQVSSCELQFVYGPILQLFLLHRQRTSKKRFYNIDTWNRWRPKVGKSVMWIWMPPVRPPTNSRYRCQPKNGINQADYLPALPVQTVGNICQLALKAYTWD